MVPVAYDVEIGMDRLMVNFGNLFNGNKLLGEIPVHTTGDISCWVGYLFIQRET
jgi:hypothetical protein